MGHFIRDIFFRIFMALPVLFTAGVQAQYAPPAGQPGSTAIHRDSALIIGWASDCMIWRGYINMADTTVTYNGFNKATYGSYLYGSGPADELVVSLGDQGTALLGFAVPIENREGPDFAVFENAFGDNFLELATVEVSSDGVRFVRFPAVSLTGTDQQVNTFDTLDATRIHNLAGKYRHGYGTPFDLNDLADSAGINLARITHVRIRDVGGCLLSPFATFDSQGHKINDPWPTPFDTGGFDLDAVGVIHDTTHVNGLADLRPHVTLWPNPVADAMTVRAFPRLSIGLVLSTTAGKVIRNEEFIPPRTFDLTLLPAGFYLATFTFPDGTRITRKIIRN